MDFPNENQSWVVKGLGLDAQNFVQKSLEYKFSGGMGFLKFNFYWDIHAIKITNFKRFQWVLTDVYIVVQPPPQSRCITFLFFFFLLYFVKYLFLFIYLGCAVHRRDLCSLIRDQTHVPCIGRWILIHCTIREVWRNRTFKNVYFIYPITIMYTLFF